MEWTVLGCKRRGLDGNGRACEWTRRGREGVKWERGEEGWERVLRCWRRSERSMS